MSFFKEAGDSLLRYTEKIVNKTEVYAKIGKLALEIKKIETDIYKTQKELGEYAYNKFNEGVQAIEAQDSTVTAKCNAIKQYHEAIARKREEIAEIRRMDSERSSKQSSTEGGDNQEGAQQ